MNTHSEQQEEHSHQSAEGVMEGMTGGVGQFVDNRPDAVAQRHLQLVANNSPQVKQLQTIQLAANKGNSQTVQKTDSGAPLQLKGDNSLMTKLAPLVGWAMHQFGEPLVGYDPHFKQLFKLINEGHIQT